MSLPSTVQTGPEPASVADTPMRRHATADRGGCGATTKPGELLAQLLEPIARLTGAKAAAVRELIGDAHFTYVASLGLPAACGPGRTMDRHCGACGQAVDTRTVVWARDFAGCVPDVGQSLTAQGRQHMVAVPLRHRGRLLGVYNLFFDAVDEPSPQTKATLGAIGELLGMALNNALVETTEHRHELALERQRMAAEVHDSVAQSVTFMKMRLALLDDALAAGDVTRARDYCRELRGVASDAHTSLRIVLTHFREASQAQPVAKVLASRVEQWRRDSDIHFTLDDRWGALDLSPVRANEVIHIVQEAVTNVIRHARATRALVLLRTLRGGGIEAVVEDDGVGLPEDLVRIDTSASAGDGAAHDSSRHPNPSHYGLAIMRERAHRLHGTLELTPREGGGTRVRLVFPERAGHALDTVGAA